jgi:hypothetical protein
VGGRWGGRNLQKIIGGVLFALCPLWLWGAAAAASRVEILKCTPSSRGSRAPLEETKGVPGECRFDTSWSRAEFAIWGSRRGGAGTRRLYANPTVQARIFLPRYSLPTFRLCSSLPFLCQLSVTVLLKALNLGSGVKSPELSPVPIIARHRSYIRRTFYPDPEPLNPNP